MQKPLLPLLFAASLTLQIPAYAQVISSYGGETTQSGQMKAANISLLTLAAALDLAYGANSEISAARREVEATEGMIQQAGIIPNPELSTTIEDLKRDTRTTTVQISQPIELGGKRSARIAAAERARDLALADLSAKQADIRALVVAAFYDVVIGQERYRLALSTVELAQRATTIASKRVLAGKISPVEETRARVAEAGVRIELAQALNDLGTARRELAATWGARTPDFDKVQEPAEDLPPLIPLPALMQRLEQSPLLARARIEVERRKAMTAVERSRRIPNVTLTLGSKRDEQVGRNTAVVGLSIPLPLFDRNQGNILEALRRTDKARDDLTTTEAVSYTHLTLPTILLV